MKPAKRPAPFSLRLSEEERARLEREAGSEPLGSYIRSKLLDEGEAPRKKARRAPPVDYALLGQILARLGKSEISANLCLLAALAEAGELPIDEETQHDLRTACADVKDMRLILIRALGLKPGGR
ncbi:hypothetical protein ACFOGJ_18140 [Marinibaculum pumilum]|uniref:Plasmid mobilization relaxosome protein MobC n=1 Tax=Marinibaculum pumilum TaxID=1766165 RepID=A0ABV7L4I2_9PROT